jgi:hypothetical protein
MEGWEQMWGGDMDIFRTPHAWVTVVVVVVAYSTAQYSTGMYSAAQNRALFFPLPPQFVG